MATFKAIEIKLKFLISHPFGKKLKPGGAAELKEKESSCIHQWQGITVKSGLPTVFGTYAKEIALVSRQINTSEACKNDKITGG